jgi:glycosyltransferase involved in cell wall biosynthesis
VDWTRQCAVIIPCRNEEGTIAPLVASLCKLLPTVFVIDDGSRDATAQVALDAGARVISLPAPKGKGAALRVGFAAADQAGFRWALMLDGDGQHDPADAPRFFHEAKAGADLVIGNRMGSAAQMTFVRRTVNRWMSRRISRRTGVHCPDSQCGFRLARIDFLKSLNSRRFEIESEMLLSAARAGHRISFVPIPVKSTARASHIHPVADTVRWFCWWFAAGS